MPILNRKLLVYLLLGTLLCSGVLFLLHYVQSDRATDALRWQAERSAENGKLEKAIAYMKQYLELRPTDHEAAVKLGDMILSRGNKRRELASVLFLYERVLRESPNRDDLRRRLVDICMKLNRHGDAAIHVKALLDQSPKDGELWEKLGTAQTVQNKPDDARASFEKAISSDATRVRSYELLADLLIRQLSLPEEGRECIEKMVRANPSAADAYLVRARYQRSQNKTDECLKDVTRALELNPKSADGMLLLADVMQSKGEIDKARKTFAEGLALHPKEIRFYRSLSWLELCTGNVPAAIACLENGMKHLPYATELLAPLGDLFVQQGELERVAEIIKKLEGKQGADGQIKYLRARQLMMRSKWQEAHTLLEGLRNDAVAMPGLNAEVNYLQAICHEQLGNPEGQMESLKRVLAIDAGHLKSRLKFGAMRLAAGDFKEAIEEYTVAARSPFAALHTRHLLGRLLIARARMNGGTGEWNVVSEYVAAVRERYPRSVEPVLLAAESHVARQQYEPARKMLREEAGKKLNDPRIWSMLATIALETDGMPAAFEVLEDAHTLIGDHVTLRLARARTWLADWQPGRDVKIRKLSLDADGFSANEQAMLFSGLADVFYSLGDLKERDRFQTMVGRSVHDDLKDLLPKLEADLSDAFRKADQAAIKKRVDQLFYDPRLSNESAWGVIHQAMAKLAPEAADKVPTWLEPIVKKSGTALMRLAAMRQQGGKLEPARALVAKALTASPKLVDAWIARIRLQPEAAIDSIRQARTVLDDQPWFVVCAETIDVLQKEQMDWLPEFKKPEEPRMFAQARLHAYALRGQFDKATDVLSKLRDDPKARPEDVAWARRNLAMLAALNGTPDERRKAVQTLRELLGDTSGGMDELRARVTSLTVAARHLHGAERKETLRQAIDAMKKVATDQEGSATDWYRLAQLYRVSGARDDYEKSIQEAMKRDESNLFFIAAHVEDLIADGDLQRAEPFIARLQQSPNDPRATTAIVRFFTLANQPQKAIDAVELYVRSADPGTAEGPARIRQSAEILDPAARLARAKGKTGDKLLLAAALERYKVSLKTFPETAAPMSALLAFDGQTQAAFDLLTSMKSSLAFKVLTTAAVALLRTGNAEPKDFVLVKGWIDEGLKESPNSSSIRLNLAEWHALRHEYATAEPIYRDVLNGEPENFIALNNLAWILAPRLDLTDEAMKYVERAIELSGPSGELLDTRARIWIARGEFDRANEDLEQALEQSQTSVRYFHLAMAQLKQLKKNEAAQSFKEARSRGLHQKLIHPTDVPAFKLMASTMGER